MSDRYLEHSCCDAYLIGSPDVLAELLNTVDIALSSPSGHASVEFQTPSGESFTLHIVRQLKEEDKMSNGCPKIS